MSEINCNKLEITSLRQCDSIKIRGNIGPCIIEGPARQDSCQGCQPGCSYWICHTHSDQPCKNYRLHWFLVFICACLWAWGCSGVFEHILNKPWEKCGRSYVCMCMCVYKSVCVVCSCAQTCTCCKNRNLNQVLTHLGLKNLRVRLLRVCWLGLWEATREHTDHISISRYGCHPVIISNTHLHSTLLFAAT